MARRFSSGFELNSNTNGVEWDNFNANSTTPATIQGTIVRTGNYAVKFQASPSGSPHTNQAIRTSYPGGDTRVFLRTYFYVESFPNVEMPIVGIFNDLGQLFASVHLKTDHTLQLVADAINTNIGSPTAALTTGHWYKLDLKIDDASNAAAIVDARLNGSALGPGTVNYTGAISHGPSQIGIGTGIDNIYSATTGVLYFDDIAINDTSGPTDANYPPDAGIFHLQPNAAGQTNNFTTHVGGDPTGGNATNWTRVDEITPDDATSYNASNSRNDIDDFNITDTPASLGAADTVYFVQLNCRYAGAGGSNNPIFVARLAELYPENGQEENLNSSVDNGTLWVTANLGIAYESPLHNTWTKDILDNHIQIGYAITTSGINDLRISTVWALVESTSSTPVIVSDSTTTSEFIDVLWKSERDIAVNDTLTTSESMVTDLISLPQVNDTGSVSDLLINVLQIDNIKPFEPLTTTEFFDVLLNQTRNINVTESLTTTESFAVVRGGTLDISVGDSLSVSESFDILLGGGRFVNVFDSTNTSEMFLINEFRVNVGENVLTATEFVDVLLDSTRNISVFTNVTTSELVFLIGISVNDAVTTDDSLVSLDLSIPSYNPRINETVTTVTFIDVLLDNRRDIVMSDTTPTTDFSNIAEVYLISVEDDATTSDLVTKILYVPDLQFENVHASESIDVLWNNTRSPSVQDSIDHPEFVDVMRNSTRDIFTPQETISTDETIYINVFRVDIADPPGVSSSINVRDTLDIIRNNTRDVGIEVDSTTVTEFVDVMRNSTRDVTAGENVSVVDVLVYYDESVFAEDHVAIQLFSSINVNDSLPISEAVSIVPTLGNTHVFDNATTTEQLTTTLVSLIHVSDSVSSSDAANAVFVIYLITESDIAISESIATSVDDRILEAEVVRVSELPLDIQSHFLVHRPKPSTAKSSSKLQSITGSSASFFGTPKTGIADPNLKTPTTGKSFP